MGDLPQSSVIMLYLLIGFIVFIVLRGETPAYKAAIFGGTAPASTTGK